MLTTLTEYLAALEGDLTAAEAAGATLNAEAKALRDQWRAKSKEARTTWEKVALLKATISDVKEKKSG